MSLKLTILLLLVALLGIFIAENLALVRYTFLSWSVELPRYQLALGLVAAGFVMGLLVMSMLRRKSKSRGYIVSQKEKAERMDDRN